MMSMIPWSVIVIFAVPRPGIVMSEVPWSESVICQAWNSHVYHFMSMVPRPGIVKYVVPKPRI